MDGLKSPTVFANEEGLIRDDLAAESLPILTSDLAGRREARQIVQVPPSQRPRHSTGETAAARCQHAGTGTQRLVAPGERNIQRGFDACRRRTRCLLSRPP